jgi:hypothetical protein
VALLPPQIQLFPSIYRKDRPITSHSEALLRHSIRKPFGTLVRKPPSVLAFRNVCIHLLEAGTDLRHSAPTRSSRPEAHHNQQKLRTLSVDKFLRPFLLHILPQGFVRIRNFGFLANRRRTTLLPLYF